MRKPKNGKPDVLCLLLNPDNGGLYAIFKDVKLLFAVCCWEIECSVCIGMN